MQHTNSIVIGHRDVDPKAPSHVAGVHEGNWPIRARRKMREKGKDASIAGGARRSTGIAPTRHDVLDPRMPRLTPP